MLNLQEVTMLWQIHAPSRALALQTLCIFSCILFGVQICSCNIASNNYRRTDNTRLTDSYTKLQKVTEIACCSRCHTDSSCKSVSYNLVSQECRLSSVSVTNVGSNSERSAEWATYSEPARHGDCSDIGRKGNVSSGVFQIFPAGVQIPVKVFCDFDDLDGPWTVIQRRVDDTVDFYRSYREYQVGFGILSGNFWLGLDKISSISLQNGKNYCLKVTVVDPVNGKMFANYSRFQVMSATTGYRLQVGNYKGNAGDTLSSNNDQPFTTHDRDMDSSSINCAWMYKGGGWWYTNCGETDLNGKYGYRIAWSTDTTSATFASMKLKECI